METYLFKFSVCLVIFWLVYVLFLERQNMHRFKRFYLLGALTLALIIPKLTIKEYVEPIVTTFETTPTFINIEPAFLEIPEEPPFFDLETTLWFIYGIGALLFALRFFNNLFQMQRRISKNETVKNRSFIYVLLQENLIPHSFFRYIFFNKTRYESHSIPKEVVLHEETHAKQLHSLDIIILELLQIAFWFHPLIYILKHHVKLNHEFLADQAVLQQGSDAKTYQTILLQFSSNTQNHQLSSAINYSSIKKRFTVMKTQTSKTRIWLSTVLVLPIIAVLFYNFAEREYVEKEESSTINHVEHIKDELKKAEKLQIHYVDQNAVEIYLKKYDIYEALRTTEPHYIFKSKKQQEDLDDLFSDLGGLYYRMSKENKAKVKRPIAGISPYAKITLNGETYFKKQSELTTEERATLPPPPPPPLPIQNTNYNLKEEPIMVILINRNGQLLVKDNYASLESIESKLKTLSKSFDDSNSVFVRIDKSVASEKTLNKVVALIRNYDFKIIQADASLIAPPSPPAKQTSKGGPNAGDTQSVYNPSFLEYIIEMENEDATFYLDDEKITAKKAKSIAANNKGKSTDILTQLDANGKYVVKLSNRKNYVSTEKEVQEIPTTKQVAEYNTWAKQLKKETLAAQENERNGKTANYPIVKQKDLIKYVGVYKRMTTKQKENSVKLPLADDELKTTGLKFPPPPPPTKQNQTYTLKTKSVEIKEVVEDLQPEKKERILPIVNGRVIKTGQLSMSLTKIKKIILTLPNSGVTAFKLKIPGLSTQHIKGNTINDEAIKNLNSAKIGDVIILFQIIDDKESDISPVTIEITDETQTKKPQSITPFINGKALKSGKTSMTRAEFKALNLSTKNGAATQFNIKIPHKPTQSIKGNTIDATTIKNLETIKAKTEVIIFNIEDSSDSNVEPIIITITD